MSDTFDNFPMSFADARDEYRAYRAVCTRVVDGDTYDFTLDMGISARLGRVRIRIREVDTPEIFHPKSDEEKQRGLAATEFVKKLILDRPCLVRTYRTKNDLDDKTLERYLGTVWYFGLLLKPVDLAQAIREAGFEK